jgi:hypothetical protein
MKAKDRDLLFEAVIYPGGSVRLPPAEAGTFREGEHVVVRLQSAPMGKELAARGIREEEIRLIAETQLESRERVIRFLLAEGVLRRGAGKRRIRGGG